MGATGDREPCRDASCGCGDQAEAGPSRRAFVQLVGLGALAASAGPAASMPAASGPFEDENEYLAVIPRDKRLDPKWVAALYERGEKPVYSEPEALRHIGMPVGGLFAGTVYLGGDGRLWLWDVFNEDQEGIEPRTVRYQGRDVTTRDGANYVSPAEPASPFALGFVLEVNGETRRLDARDWTHVAFDGRYPIGRVKYADPKCPVEVTLEAFSPFCPMELDDSSLPAVLMEFSISNESDRPVNCALRGGSRTPWRWGPGGRTTDSGSTSCRTGRAGRWAWPPPHARHGSTRRRGTARTWCSPTSRGRPTAAGPPRARPSARGPSRPPGRRSTREILAAGASAW
ncbi:MAG: GH116 family glycosyl-hydrolase [Isosphaeraceae bacterium]